LPLSDLCSFCSSYFELFPCSFCLSCCPSLTALSTVFPSHLTIHSPSAPLALLSSCSC
jgi:hypothetical protein